MEIEKTELKGLLIIKPKIFPDDRGSFMETYQQERYGRIGLTERFVQDNLSRSKKNVIRALHFQVKHPQGKLVQVIRGSVFDVAVDIRPDSPTFGQYFSVVLSADNNWQIWVPPGFAHGFGVLTDWADVMYKCTDFYHAEDESGIIWNDSDIDIKWPMIDPIVSDKDRTLKLLRQLDPNVLPRLDNGRK